MAIRAIVQSECNESNRRERLVDIRTTFPRNQYWSQGTLGDFFIAGGGQNQRDEAVVGYIQTSLRRCLKPVIVFDGTGTLERRLISLYTPYTDRGGRNHVDGYGTLKIYSPTSRGYDIFGGMNFYTVLEFLKEATKDRPRGSEISPAYIEAFLDTITGVTPLTLEGMRQISEKSDAEIAQIASNLRRERRIIDVLKNPDNNGVNFRTFLRELESAFSNIWRRNTVTGNSILRDLGIGGIIYINAQTINPALFNRYFSTVLNYIGNSQYRLFDVVLNGVTIYQNDGISDHIAHAMNRTNETIGLCYYNIAPFIQAQPFICDMPRQIVFTSNRSMVPADLLRSYGTYTYYFPKKVFHPGLNLFFWAADWTIATNIIDRVRPQDINDEHADMIMKGYNGERIALVRNA